MKLIKKIIENKGCKRWTEIVKYFDGRTENALKNRYNLIVDKIKKTEKGKTELEIVKEYLEKCYS